MCDAQPCRACHHHAHHHHAHHHGRHHGDCACSWCLSGRAGCPAIVCSLVQPAIRVPAPTTTTGVSAGNKQPLTHRQTRSTHAIGEQPVVALLRQLGCAQHLAWLRHECHRSTHCPIVLVHLDGLATQSRTCASTWGGTPSSNRGTTEPVRCTHLPLQQGAPSHPAPDDAAHRARLVTWSRRPCDGCCQTHHDGRSTAPSRAPPWETTADDQREPS